MFTRTKHSQQLSILVRSGTMVLIVGTKSLNQNNFVIKITELAL